MTVSFGLIYTNLNKANRSDLRSSNIQLQIYTTQTITNGKMAKNGEKWQTVLTTQTGLIGTKWDYSNKSNWE